MSDNHRRERDVELAPNPPFNQAQNMNNNRNNNDDDNDDCGVVITSSTPSCDALSQRLNDQVAAANAQILQLSNQQAAATNQDTNVTALPPVLAFFPNALPFNLPAGGGVYDAALERARCIGCATPMYQLTQALTDTSQATIRSAVNATVADPNFHHFISSFAYQLSATPRGADGIALPPPPVRPLPQQTADLVVAFLCRTPSAELETMLNAAAALACMHLWRCEGCVVAPAAKPLRGEAAANKKKEAGSVPCTGFSRKLIAAQVDGAGNVVTDQAGSMISQVFDAITISQPCISMLMKHEQCRDQDCSACKTMKPRYGSYLVTSPQVLRMYREQGGVCSLCRGQLCHQLGSWHLDHSHSCGGERGLLCSMCNMLLVRSVFELAPNSFLRIVDYITTTASTQQLGSCIRALDILEQQLRQLQPQVLALNDWKQQQQQQFQLAAVLEPSQMDPVQLRESVCDAVSTAASATRSRQESWLSAAVIESFCSSSHNQRLRDGRNQIGRSRVQQELCFFPSPDQHVLRLLQRLEGRLPTLLQHPSIQYFLAQVRATAAIEFAQVKVAEGLVIEFDAEREKRINDAADDIVAGVAETTKRLQEEQQQQQEKERNRANRALSSDEESLRFVAEIRSVFQICDVTIRNEICPVGCVFVDGQQMWDMSLLDQEPYASRVEYVLHNSRPDNFTFPPLIETFLTRRSQRRQQHRQQQQPDQQLEQQFLEDQLIEQQLGSEAVKPGHSIPELGIRHSLKSYSQLRKSVLEQQQQLQNEQRRASDVQRHASKLGSFILDEMTRRGVIGVGESKLNRHLTRLCSGRDGESQDFLEIFVRMTWSDEIWKQIREQVQQQHSNTATNVNNSNQDFHSLAIQFLTQRLLARRSTSSQADGTATLNDRLVRCETNEKVMELYFSIAATLPVRYLRSFAIEDSVDESSARKWIQLAIFAGLRLRHLRFVDCAVQRFHGRHPASAIDLTSNRPPSLYPDFEEEERFAAERRQELDKEMDSCVELVHLANGHLRVFQTTTIRVCLDMSIESTVRAADTSRESVAAAAAAARRQLLESICSAMTCSIVCSLCKDDLRHHLRGNVPLYPATDLGLIDPGLEIDGRAAKTFLPFVAQCCGCKSVFADECTRLPVRWREHVVNLSHNDIRNVRCVKYNLVCCLCNECARAGKIPEEAATMFGSNRRQQQQGQQEQQQGSSNTQRDEHQRQEEREEQRHQQKIARLMDAKPVVPQWISGSRFATKYNKALRGSFWFERQLSGGCSICSVSMRDARFVIRGRRVLGVVCLGCHDPLYCEAFDCAPEIVIAAPLYLALTEPRGRHNKISSFLDNIVQLREKLAQRQQQQQQEESNNNQQQRQQRRIPPSRPSIASISGCTRVMGDNQWPRLCETQQQRAVMMPGGAMGADAASGACARFFHSSAVASMNEILKIDNGVAVATFKSRQVVGWRQWLRASLRRHVL